MKFVVFSYDGHGLPIAHHLMQEGHDVEVGIVEDKKDVISKFEKETVYEEAGEKALRLSLFDGILNKTPATELIEKLKTVRDPENYFVFFDFNNMFKFSEQIKDMPFHGNFPTEEDHLFEIDRDEAKEFVNKNYDRVKIAGKKEFKRIADAEKFLKETDEIWVLKGLNESARSVVPDIDDPQLAAGQILDALYQDKETYENPGFMLENLIPNVIELTPEKIYYDGVPLAVTINFESKPLGSGDISIQTGCTADLVFPIDMEDRICKIAFPPIVDEIAKKHKGLFIWDASLLINKRDGKIYFGEFCSNRPGYNSSFTELSQAKSVGDFFMDVSQKKNPFKLGSVGTSVRIFNMNRNPSTQQIMGGIKIDYKPGIEKDLWLWDAKREKGKLVSVGYDWNLAVMTGSNRSIDDAVQRLYKNIDNFSFVGGYYRPKFDYLSLEYPTSILNRLNYGVERGLYKLHFAVKVGHLDRDLP